KRRVDFIFRGTGSAYGVANFVLGLEEWISSGVFREKGGATRIKMESTIVHDAINWEAARWRINRRAPAHIWFGFGGSAQGSWMERESIHLHAFGWAFKNICLEEEQQRFGVMGRRGESWDMEVGGHAHQGHDPGLSATATS
ncbi:hypothetical protein VIGAN_03180200, partial [Vigna angularis var. angularis]